MCNKISKILTSMFSILIPFDISKIWYPLPPHRYNSIYRYRIDIFDTFQQRHQILHRFNLPLFHCLDYSVLLFIIKRPKNGGSVDSWHNTKVQRSNHVLFRGVPKMRKCINAEVTDTKLPKWNAELKLKVLVLGLGLAMAVTNPVLATHDYDGFAEYSALTSAVYCR